MRILDCIPPPQDLLHWLYALQAVHVPSDGCTEAASILKLPAENRLFENWLNVVRRWRFGCWSFSNLTFHRWERIFIWCMLICCYSFVDVYRCSKRTCRATFKTQVNKEVGPSTTLEVEFALSWFLTFHVLFRARTKLSLRFLALLLCCFDIIFEIFYI